MVRLLIVSVVMLLSVGCQVEHEHTYMCGSMYGYSNGVVSVPPCMQTEHTLEVARLLTKLEACYHANSLPVK